MKRLITIAFFGFWLPGAGMAQAGCSTVSVDANVFTACSFDPAKSQIKIYNLGDDGMPLGSLPALERYVLSKGERLVFAMNGGMFGAGLKPIGLYVEGGKALKKLNRRSGAGNFHLKPNGVFYVAGNRAAVLTSDDYAKSNAVPDYATQSGPMLVINGQLHPKFSASGTSEKIRNGVGVKSDGTVVFAISDTLVTFTEFATLFRDTLSCPNALFLDGSVSGLYSAELGRNDGLVPLVPYLGPMVAVVEKQ
jgi:uncharacterized protein YigE (DUF2233 family)